MTTLSRLLSSVSIFLLTEFHHLLLLLLLHFHFHIFMLFHNRCCNNNQEKQNRLFLPTHILQSLFVVSINSQYQILPNNILPITVPLKTQPLRVCICTSSENLFGCSFYINVSQFILTIRNIQIAVSTTSQP